MAQNESKEEEIPINEEEEKEIEQLIQSLPKAMFMGCSNISMIKYQNFWFSGPKLFKNELKCQKHFNAQDTDLIVASHPKTGTTWLNALLFAVVNRVNHPMTESPLLSNHPHHLVTRLEHINYGGANLWNQLTLSHLHELPSPRLFSTHFPYKSLPESIKTSGCRILYICRNPFDTFVSQWNFYLKVTKQLEGDQGSKPYSMEDFFEDWLKGNIYYGPFFEHLIDYWMQSLEKPTKVLFVKYEDLKEDPTLHLKRIAEFVGMPFSLEEENKDVIRKLTEMCNINNMKELDVNKKGVIYTGLERTTFFRKGEVGDWTNYFSPSMEERMNKLMQQKLEGTGLTFKFTPE